MNKVAFELLLRRSNEVVAVPWWGYVTGVPGLVVCHAPDRADGGWVELRREWQVVHVLSGFRINRENFTTRAQALAVVEAVGPLADWTRPADELGSDLQLSQRVSEVLGAAA